MRYHVRRNADSYGHGIGILLIDCASPFIPGDVGNASTYPFPVLYRTVKGVTLERLIEQGDESLTDAVIAAALALQDMGVRAVASDCGYMALFQTRVAAALRVPAILSSLLQLPLIAQSLGPTGEIGVICANGRRMTPALLRAAGVQDPARLIIRGLEDKPHFRAPVLDETGAIEPEKVEAEVVETAEAMLRDNPGIGAFLLECSNLPPYAHAVQAATGRPVFDFNTMIEMFFAAATRKPYQGIY